MLDVILDSSIIFRDRAFLGSDFLLLRKLSELRLIRLHIPWVVLQEIISSSVNDRLDAIKQIKKQMEILNRIGNQKKRKADLLRISNVVSKIEESCEIDTNKYWKDFIKTAKVVVDEMAPADGYAVMHSYFCGKLPFSKQKNRKDIPDAFIFESVRRISEKKPAVFLCGDDQLRTSCSGLQGITCCVSIKEFYELASVQVIITEYEKLNQLREGIRFISLHKADILRQAKEDIFGDLLVQFNYGGIESICIPRSGGVLTDIFEPLDIQVMASKSKYVDGIFYVPISVKCRFEIEYYLHKDLYPGYKSRSIRIIQDASLGDDYCIKEIVSATFFYDYQLSKAEIDARRIRPIIDERVYNLSMKPIMMESV